MKVQPELTRHTGALLSIRSLIEKLNSAPTAPRLGTPAGRRAAAPRRSENTNSVRKLRMTPFLSPRPFRISGRQTGTIPLIVSLDRRVRENPRRELFRRVVDSIQLGQRGSFINSYGSEWGKRERRGDIRTTVCTPTRPSARQFARDKWSRRIVNDVSIAR